MTSPKLASWDGANKARVRLFKKHDITNLIRTDKNKYDRPKDWQPAMLSFPGPNAVLERLLVNLKTVAPDKITAIQTYERLSRVNDGELFLKKLIRTRSKYLPHMKIWPYNFSKFAEKYNLGGCEYPSNSTSAKWKHPPYKRFMDELVKAPTERFAILDLDLCGVFSKKNADSIENLFSARVLDNSGVLFITHQKGRDVRQGALFDVLHGYLRDCRFIDFKTIPHIDEEGYETYVARYILVPLYYMCKAYEYGFAMKLTRLIEYRDLNDDSHQAVNMLQYFFKWVDADYKQAADTFVRVNLEDVMREQYEYLNFVD